MTRLLSIIVVCALVAGAIGVGIVVFHFSQSSDIETFPVIYEKIELENETEFSLVPNLVFANPFYINAFGLWYSSGGRWIYNYNISTGENAKVYDMLWWWDEFTYDSSVQAFAVGSNELWIGTSEGITVMDIASKTFKNFTPEDGLPEPFHPYDIDVNEKFAVCNMQDHLIYYSKSGDQWTVIANKSVTDINLDGDKLWLVDEGVYYFNLTENSFYFWNSSSNSWQTTISFGNPSVTSVHKGALRLTTDLHTVWAMDERNVSFYNKTENKWYMLETKGRDLSLACQIFSFKNFLFIGGNEWNSYNRNTNNWQIINVSQNYSGPFAFYNDKLWVQGDGKIYAYSITVRTVQTRVTQEWLDANVSVPVLMVEGEARR